MKFNPFVFMVVWLVLFGMSSLLTDLSLLAGALSSAGLLFLYCFDLANRAAIKGGD